MSTSQTPNYGLHQWAGGDQFKRTDFNEDNAKVDEALQGLRSDLTALSAAVDGKAAQSGLDALSAAVDQKADQTSLDALAAKVDAKAEQSALTALTATVNAKADQSALNALSATVSGKGNCRIVTGSYTGTGTYGASTPNTLTFDGKPLFVTVGGDYILMMVRGSSASSSSASYGPTVSWGDRTVSWYSVNGELHQFNRSGIVYSYIALMAAG